MFKNTVGEWIDPNHHLPKKNYSIDDMNISVDVILWLKFKNDEDYLDGYYDYDENNWDFDHHVGLKDQYKVLAWSYINRPDFLKGE